MKWLDSQCARVGNGDEMSFSLKDWDNGIGGRQPTILLSRIMQNSGIATENPVFVPHYSVP